MPDDLKPSQALGRGKAICTESVQTEVPLQELWTWFTASMGRIVWPSGYALSDAGAEIEDICDLMFGSGLNLPLCEVQDNNLVKIDVIDGYIVTYVVQFRELSSSLTEVSIVLYDDSDHFDHIDNIPLGEPSPERCRLACQAILRAIAERKGEIC